MLGNMKTGTKVLAGFVFAVIIAVIIGVVGYRGIQDLSQQLENVGGVRLPSVHGLYEIEVNQLNIAYANRGMINRRYFRDAELRKTQFEQIELGIKGIEDGLSVYEPLEQTPEEKAKWNKYKPQLDKYLAHMKDSFLPLSKEKLRLYEAAVAAAGVQGLLGEAALDYADADPAVKDADAKLFESAGEARRLMRDSQELLQEVIELNLGLADAARKEAQATAESSRTLMVVALVIGAFVMFTLGFVLARGIGKVLNNLVAEARRLSEAAVAGQLDTRGDVQIVPLEFQPIVQGVNETLDAVIGPLNVAAEYVDRISKGDIPPRITDAYKGDFNEIKNNLNQCIDIMNGLLQETGKLVDAAKNGKLDARADARKFEGGWGELVGGVNELLDAVIRPLNVSAEYVDRISKGDIPPKITEQYNGDFNEIKNNLNQCIDALSGLIGDMNHMSKQHDLGDIDVIMPVEKYQGAYKMMAQGVNDMVNGHIAVKKKAMACVKAFGEGNFEADLEKFPGKKAFINQTIEQVRHNLKALISDTELLVRAAVEGKLDTRADASKHQGDFRKIVQGVNETLDAVLNPIKEASSVLEELANYDLRARVQGDYKGDHAKIKTSLNQTAQALHDSLAQVAEAVDQVNSAGEQIARSSQMVAEGASQQASALEETSSSLEEMAGMTRQNADNTQQAKVLAEGTREAAMKGSSAMEKMVVSMGKIRAASEGTAQIIKDINDIAFQTNLLALNAAVEAARAGDAGRGFAVVAEEVRNLAGRAKEAAKKTEELIAQSVKLAEDGEVISGEVNSNLAQIVDSVGKVTSIVAEIAVASTEQARGIEQVNKAVAEMDKVVQQAAANSEESSSAAEELASQSQELAAMVGRFQLSRNASGFGVRKGTHAVHKSAVKSAAKSAAKPATKLSGKPSSAMAPEDIIPLDSDPDFSEF